VVTATMARNTCDVARRERVPARPPCPASRDEVGRLVYRAAGGDERAWTLLLGRFDASIRSQARRFGLSPADRDDVAQRTWLIVYRHIGRLESHPAVGGWILTTARNECLRVLEGRRRELPLEDPTGGCEREDRPIDDELLADERRRALRRALDGVPEHERCLMRLMLQELSYDEISAALGIPKGSIGPTRGRCLARLRGDRHLESVIRGRPLPGHDLGS
jgi:RNA polymerase sigma factor (sigma-70 family)